MKEIKILDCTLRDGGYINEWNFGRENALIVVKALSDANIDIIEVGFLSNRVQKNQDLTKFSSIFEISNFIRSSGSKSKHVCMINFGEYDVNTLPEKKTTFIDGIRVAFHKKDYVEALKDCTIIKAKGYEVYVQPMVAANYTDEEYKDLILKANKIKPYAYYVVDSFGEMSESDTVKYFNYSNIGLSKDIVIGLHSHNNLQLSYSNAKTFVNLDDKRQIIIDSSTHGMGRGAGNLNTELFVEYLNQVFSKEYIVNPLLKMIDYVIKPIYATKKWGYSLPYYLSATNNCHPNYATYLDDRNTLQVSDISKILKNLDTNKKNNFDKKYIHNMYLSYLQNSLSIRNDIEKVREIIEDKKVILVAPGNSIKDSKMLIDRETDNGTIIIAVNFIPKNIDVDIVFFSNKKRYNYAEFKNGEKCLITSNIESLRASDYIVDYSSLLNETSAVEDNSGMMLLKLLTKLDVKSVLLAGFDGYSLDGDFSNNFVDEKYSIVQSQERVEKINLGMNYLLNQFSKKIDIKFITKPKNIKVYK